MRKADRSIIENALGPVYAHIVVPAENAEHQNEEYIGIDANASAGGGRLKTLVHTLNLLSRAGLLYDPAHPDTASQQPSLEMIDACTRRNDHGVSVLDMVFRDHNFKSNSGALE
jgi:hypothetical protein